MHAKVDEDPGESMSENGDRGACIQKHAHDEEQQAEKEQTDQRVRGKPEDEIGNDLRRIAQRDYRLERQRGADEEQDDGAVRGQSVG